VYSDSDRFSVVSEKAERISRIMFQYPHIGEGILHSCRLLSIGIILQLTEIIPDRHQATDMAFRQRDPRSLRSEFPPKAPLKIECPLIMIFFYSRVLVAGKARQTFPLFPSENRHRKQQEANAMSHRS
jgi:hypothetical protein